MIEIKCVENKAVAIDTSLNKEIGICEFSEKEGVLNIYHTKVSTLYRGQNIAKRLVECVLENARKNNKKVVASCSYANKILEFKNIK